MLAERFTVDTPLPQPGSFGFLRGTAQRCRVLRRNGDGHCLVQLYHRPRGYGEWQPAPGSSGNATLAEADIYETEHLAAHCGRPPRPPRPRRRRTAQ